MHHYINEKRFGLTVNPAFKTLTFCLPNNGHPVIVLNHDGAHTVSAYSVNHRQFSALCALIEAADALLPVLDLVFSDSEKDVLESCGWQFVNQTAELVHDFLPDATDVKEPLHSRAKVGFAIAS
jgi:hypothetical protein